VEMKKTYCQIFFIFLVTSATYWQIEIIEGKWIRRPMKGFFLDTQQTSELKKFIIPEPRLSWNP